MSNPTRPVPYNLGAGHNVPVPVQELTDDGVITIPGGVVQLNKAGVIAATLAAPEVDGLILHIDSLTAQTHAVTVEGGLRGAGSGADVGTFGGSIGDGVTLYSYNGAWYPMPGTNVNVTFA